MICFSTVGRREPSDLLLSVDKKRSSIGLYDIGSGPVPYDLAGAISLIPSIEVIETMLIAD